MEIVARRIEQLVRSRELRAGDRLPPEPELARMLHVSRSSLREALKALLFVGLLKARPGRGTYVQPSLSRVMSRHFQWMVLFQDIKHFEIYELRQMVEPAAAALAARRASSDDIARMEEALAAMRLSLDKPEQFHQHDIAFHEAFARASGNAALQTTMSVLYDAMAEARLRVLPFIENMRRHWERHERVFRHIRDRRPELARRAVAEDLRYAQKLLRRALKTQERDKSESVRRARPWSVARTAAGHGSHSWQAGGER